MDKRGRDPQSPASQLLDDVAQCLASREPLDLLQQVSAMIAVVDPRRKSPFDASEDIAHASLEELAESFAAADEPETSALLVCIGQLAADELVRARARRAFTTRRHQLPLWLASLRGTRVRRAVVMTEPLGDGDDVLLGMVLGSGHEFSLLIYIDHNLGTVVKDGFAVPGSVDDLVSQLQENSIDPDIRFAELSLADARARVEAAVAVGVRMFPPLETETWPAIRPLAEWAIRLMPGGGTGYLRPEWSDADKKKLAEAFFASEFAAGLDDAGYRSLLDDFLWFGTDYGPGDPLRWSPVAVELILMDWIPRKLEAEIRHLRRAPALLRAFVRFCHRQRNVRSDRTEETLDCIDAFEPRYQEVIREARLQGPAALLDSMGALDPESAHDMLSWPIDADAAAAEDTLAELVDAVGGESVLDSLADGPLPDEPFGWTGIADDIRPVVTEVLRACDSYCDQFLDGEYRTACRRLLARIASSGPAVFRRKASPAASAAAVIWLIGKANDLFDIYSGPYVKDLMAHFGTGSSATQRARAFLRAAGLEGGHGLQMPLGSPDLLVRERRRKIIEQRDRCRAVLADDAAQARGTGRTALTAPGVPG
jgi:uncharacterized protein DUF6398